MKKIVMMITAAVLGLAMLAGCGAPASSQAGPASEPAASAPAPAGSETGPESAPEEKASISVAGLKGPTTMGMVKLMEQAEAGETPDNYEVGMYGTADEITGKLISGDIQIAAVPANLASVLYNNSGGKIRVAAINTLGVLYVVETGEAVQSVEDLQGKTVYSTGKGTTPEFALNYILTQNGLDPAADLTIEYKSESTEIAALLAGEGTDAIAVLPQPYVTAVQMQNEGVRVALDLTEEWSRVSEDSGLVTGVLVANAAWLEENAASFDAFLDTYKASIEWVNANTADAAELVARYGIVEKAPVAEKALPACNIVYMDGAQMQQMLAGYLQVLYDQLPESVGGQLPGDGFYYTGQ